MLNAGIAGLHVDPDGVAITIILANTTKPLQMEEMLLGPKTEVPVALLKT